jgi:hypothetical protein
VLTAGFAGAVVDLTRQLVAFDSVNPGLVPGAVGEGPMLRRFPVGDAVGRFLAAAS